MNFTLANRLEKPRNFKLQTRESNFAVFIWQKPANAIADSTVYYEVYKQESQELTLIANTTITSYQLTGLKARQQIVLIVRAVSVSQGYSDFTESVSYEHIMSPSKPRKLKLKSFSTSSISLSWLPPTETGSTSVLYNLYFYLPSGEGPVDSSQFTFA